MAQHQSLAKDLFEDMGRKVAEASAQGDNDEGSKVVDEIESLCMNCHENVGIAARCIYLANTSQGNYAPAPHPHTLLPRNCSHVLFMPALPL